MNIKQITPDENEYVRILTSVDSAPKSLYYMGTLPSKRQPTVSIVGTRKPTKYGEEVTYQFAYDLAKRGIAIASGLALGVDAIAHRAALDAGGTTLVVLASGLPDITPRTNRDLGLRILKQGGAILSEYPPRTAPQKHYFLERNRLVSGLSDALLITEAAIRSGTLSTAAHALSQGREVFVIPGNITSPQSAGCNKLIRQGATPVTSTQDILEVIAPATTQQQTTMPLGDNELQTQILTLLAGGVRDGDDLQQRLQIDAPTLNTELTMLELNGLTRSLGANQWTIK